MADQVVQDDLSLEQIEDSYWGDPPPEATRLIETVHRLRRKPIGLFDAEDFRILLGQRLSVETLLPRALELLEEEPLLEGDLYRGDVLVATMRAPSSFWHQNPELLTRLERVIESIDKQDEDFDDILEQRIEEFHQHIRS
jgi:CDI immunity proteins